MIHLVRTIIFLWSLLISGNCFSSFTKPWTYELIDMTYHSSNPDMVEMSYKVERIDRGRYGFSGFLDIKTDLNDDVLCSVTVQRSKGKGGPFKPTPVNMNNETLTNAMNNFYKNVLMTSVEECCENCPIFNDTFLAPLTKRQILINKCEVSTADLPNVVMEAYYLLRVTLQGAEFKAYLETLVYVENH